jgi:hypothetical protein
MPLGLVVFELAVAAGLSRLAPRRRSLRPTSRSTGELETELKEILAERREEVTR